MQDSKVVDQTRGILTYVEENCPGRFHEEIQYISVSPHTPSLVTSFRSQLKRGLTKSVRGWQVAGRFIQGAKFRDKEATLRQKVVGLGYQQVCGVADVWGDGVVPEPAAHLPGTYILPTPQYD